MLYKVIEAESIQTCMWLQSPSPWTSYLEGPSLWPPFRPCHTILPGIPHQNFHCLSPWCQYRTPPEADQDLVQGWLPLLLPCYHPCLSTDMKKEKKHSTFYFTAYKYYCTEEQYILSGRIQRHFRKWPHASLYTLGPLHVMARAAATAAIPFLMRVRGHVF